MANNIVKYNRHMADAGNHIYQQLKSMIEAYDIDEGISLYIELNDSDISKRINELIQQEYNASLKITKKGILFKITKFDPKTF